MTREGEVHQITAVPGMQTTSYSTEPDRKKNNKLLRADIILEQARADIHVSEYIEDSGDFPEFQDDRTAGRKAAARIKPGPQNASFAVGRSPTSPLYPIAASGGAVLGRDLVDMQGLSGHRRVSGSVTRGVN